MMSQGPEPEVLDQGPSVGGHVGYQVRGEWRLRTPAASAVEGRQPSSYHVLPSPIPSLNPRYVRKPHTLRRYGHRAAGRRTASQ